MQNIETEWIITGFHDDTTPSSLKESRKTGPLHLLLTFSVRHEIYCLVIRVIGIGQWAASNKVTDMHTHVRTHDRMLQGYWSHAAETVILLEASSATSMGATFSSISTKPDTHLVWQSATDSLLVEDLVLRLAGVPVFCSLTRLQWSNSKWLGRKKQGKPQTGMWAHTSWWNIESGNTKDLGEIRH